MAHGFVAVLCLSGLICMLGIAKAAEAEDMAKPIPTDMVEDEKTPMAVTSDTLEYCRSLSRKVHNTLHRASDIPGSVISQAMYLEHEGERLCAHGHLRAGITHERRALAVLTRS